ncbi:MAG: hypothetical protein NXI13_13585 [Proteobacteria bacterium]|nr:hypothetical protein [Pseudomonadota bacterium]
MFESLFFLLTVSLLFGLFLHILLMRKTRGKYIYLAAIILLNSALIIAIAVFYLLGAKITFEGFVIAAIFLESFALVYCFILVGVVHDSPTLAIVKALMAAEPDGLSDEGLKRFISAHPFVFSRIESLIATGDVNESEGRLYLTTRSRVILTMIGFYENIIRARRETG